jgi:predicted metal-dependent hydrolase
MSKSTKKRSAPIMTNADVKELLAILKEHNSPSMNDFSTVLNQVDVMEKQLAEAIQELTAIRRELTGAKTQPQPIQIALQKALTRTQGQVSSLQNKLSEIKQAVIEGCKNAVAAFKEKGVSALDNIARFFKVRPMLEALQASAVKVAQDVGKTIQKIELVSREYHEAGRHLKNIGRALFGREAVSKTKPQGKLAGAISSPFRAVHACLTAVGKHTATALNRLKRLEDRAKPSITETIEKHNKDIKQKNQERPAQNQRRSANAEI